VQLGKTNLQTGRHLRLVEPLLVSRPVHRLQRGRNRRQAERAQAPVFQTDRLLLRPEEQGLVFQERELRMDHLLSAGLVQLWQLEQVLLRTGLE
jgi:hypothetical protein